MAKHLSIEVLGVDEVERFLEDSTKKVQTTTKNIMRENGMLLKEEVEASILGQRAEPRSVDTGAFSQSVEVKPEGYNVEVVSTVPYSVFLEYGTIYIPERRHFRNSLDRTTPIMIEKLQDAINDELD